MQPTHLSCYFSAVHYPQTLPLSSTKRISWEAFVWQYCRKFWHRSHATTIINNFSEFHGGERICYSHDGHLSLYNLQCKVFRRFGGKHWLHIQGYCICFRLSVLQVSSSDTVRNRVGHMDCPLSNTLHQYDTLKLISTKCTYIIHKKSLPASRNATHFHYTYKPLNAFHRKISCTVRITAFINYCSSLLHA
jgi:hypothetical protein